MVAVNTQMTTATQEAHAYTNQIVQSYQAFIQLQNQFGYNRLVVEVIIKHSKLARPLTQC
jgi:hypothetical protein